MQRIAAARRGGAAGAEQGTGTRRRVLSEHRRDVPLVLVVDDREEDRRLYATGLARRGLRVEEAVDGEHAIFKVAALLPDVVVMDAAMPGLDGIAAAHQIKTHAKTKHIPLILLTAYATSELLEAAGRAGADVFLTKPCTPDELGRAIDRLLERKSSAG